MSRNSRVPSWRLMPACASRIGTIQTGVLVPLVFALVMGIFGILILTGSAAALPFPLQQATSSKSVGESESLTCDSAAKPSKVEATPVVGEGLERLSTLVNSGKESLPNLLAAHTLIPLERSIFVGGQPNGDAAFEWLQKLGVRTVVSVDGARPDLELAKRFGMRYVHIPLRYSGVEVAQVLELSAALKLDDGPVYFHCHHGRHRAPAAVACALIGVGDVLPADAVRILKAAGTGENYAGLWASVRNTRAIGNLEKQLPIELPSVAETSPFADSMSQLSRLVDRWESADSGKSNLGRASNTAELALLIRECFDEAARESILPEKFQTDQFEERLHASKRLADQLETAQDASAITGIFRQLREECKACHQLYRD